MHSLKEVLQRGETDKLIHSVRLHLGDGDTAAPGRPRLPATELVTSRTPRLFSNSWVWARMA